MEAEDVDAKFAAWQQMLAEYHATWVQLLHNSWQTASQQLADCFAAVGRLLCSSWQTALQQLAGCFAAVVCKVQQHNI